MTHQLELSPELEAKLQALAAHRGADTNATALQVLAEGLRAVPIEDAPAVGSPAASAAQAARLRALMAAPAEERAQVLAAEAAQAQAFYDSPEGRAEWEELADWRALDGLDFEGFEEEDAQARAA